MGELHGSHAVPCALGILIAVGIAGNTVLQFDNAGQYTPLDKCTYLLMPKYLFLMTRCDNMNSFIDLNTSFKSIYPPLMLIYLLSKCQYTCYWCQYVTR